MRTPTLHTHTHPAHSQVVDKELGEPIRSHKDLAKDAAPHYRAAHKFYDGIAAQLVAQGHSLDVFECALDQASACMPVCVCVCFGGGGDYVFGGRGEESERG
jgi:hypothetical protein